MAEKYNVYIVKVAIDEDIIDVRLSADSIRAIGPSNLSGTVIVSAQGLGEAEELVKNMDEWRTIADEREVVGIISIEPSYSLSTRARSAKVLEWLPNVEAPAEPWGMLDALQD